MVQDLGPTPIPFDFSSEATASLSRNCDQIPGPITDDDMGLSLSDASKCVISRLPESVRLPRAMAAQEPWQSLQPALQFFKPNSLGAELIDDTDGFEGSRAKGRLTRGSIDVIRKMCLGSLGPEFQRFLRALDASRLIVRIVDGNGRTDGLSRYGCYPFGLGRFLQDRQHTRSRPLECDVDWQGILLPQESKRSSLVPDEIARCSLYGQRGSRAVCFLLVTTYWKENYKHKAISRR